MYLQLHLWVSLEAVFDSYSSEFVSRGLSLSPIPLAPDFRGTRVLLTLSSRSKYHCMIIILYRPPLLSHRCYAGTLSLAERLNVVSNSCSAIVKMLSCAEAGSLPVEVLRLHCPDALLSSQMIEPDLITPAPYLNVPLFVAAQSSSQSELAQSPPA